MDLWTCVELAHFNATSVQKSRTMLRATIVISLTTVMVATANGQETSKRPSFPPFKISSEQPVISWTEDSDTVVGDPNDAAGNPPTIVGEPWIVPSTMPADPKADASGTDGSTGEKAGKPDAEKDSTEEEKKKKEKKEKKEKLKKAEAGAYKEVFYDNDFNYLDDPAYRGHFFGDELKQIEFGKGWHHGRDSMSCTSDACCTELAGDSCTGIGSTESVKKGPMLDIGGQYRYRYHHERNIRGLGLTGRDDNFFLQRTRLFGNFRVNDRLRFYAEYIDALSEFETFTPRPIEENRSDFLNLFVDGTIMDTGSGKLLGRVGRQELLYGAQRAISPLDWANTRRTFDGAKLMWQGKHLDVDGFWSRPLRVSARQFDNPNLDQQFYGVYSTYKDLKDTKVEGYWLGFDDSATGARVDSIGGRYYEESGNLLVEVWGNYQFGTNADDSNHSAGAWTIGLGHKSERTWNPTWWLYYDWASGDDSLGAGNGYFQFFPLAHKYLGFMDLFGRRNIESPNVQFSLQPTKKLKLLAWYYYLFLENQRDSPYSVVMTPFFGAIAPGSAALGHEIDLLAIYNLSPRSGFVLGYSHFFSGAYYNTPGLPYSGDADFFYTQYHVNF